MVPYSYTWQMYVLNLKIYHSNTHYVKNPIHTIYLGCQVLFWIFPKSIWQWENFNSKWVFEPAQPQCFCSLNLKVTSKENNIRVPRDFIGIGYSSDLNSSYMPGSTSFWKIQWNSNITLQKISTTNNND